MAIEEPTKRKRGTPADPAKSKMGQKMVHPRRALLDERSSRPGDGDEDDDDFEQAGKGGTPAGDSPHSARTKMGQKMSLAHRRLSFLDDASGINRHIAAAAAAADDDGGGGSEKMDEEFAVDVAQKKRAVDDSYDPNGSDDDFVPLIMMRTKNVKREPGKHPGSPCKHKAQRTITRTYKRKKTGRLAGSGKRKREKKPMLVDNNSISKSNKDTDTDVEPEIPDDDVRKKHASALDRALEVENKLPAEGPSFVKLMQKSHVVRGFWLGVPLSFCREHLPNDDVTIALEDEDGHSYDTKYLARKQGLSGGWHGFVVRHGLKVGDAVIFQLVGPKRFKVYILRENKFTTTDGALGLLSLDTSMEKNIPKKGEETSDEDAKSKADPDVTKVITNKASDDDSNDLFSEEAVNSGMRSADPDPGFDAVKTFRAFKTAVDSSVIDRKLVTDHQLWTMMKLERACAAEKVRALELKMASLKDALEEMDMEMEEIAGKRRGRGMLRLAAAPW